MILPAIGFAVGIFFSLLLYALLDRAYLRSIINRVYTDCITVDQANSRLAFLVASLGSTVAVVVLTVGFLISKDRSSYPTMVAAVSGGGLGSAVGRYFTKKGDAGQPDETAPPAQEAPEPEPPK